MKTQCPSCRATHELPEPTVNIPLRWLVLLVMAIDPAKHADVMKALEALRSAPGHD